MKTWDDAKVNDIVAGVTYKEIFKGTIISIDNSNNIKNLTIKWADRDREFKYSEKTYSDYIHICKNEQEFLAFYLKRK